MGRRLSATLVVCIAHRWMGLVGKEINHEKAGPAARLVECALIACANGARRNLAGLRRRMAPRIEPVDRTGRGSPAENFSWRPASGVRSTSEVYMHIVGANFYLLSVTGPKVPAGWKEGMEKT